MDGLDVTLAGTDSGLAGYRTRPRRPSLWSRARRKLGFILVVVVPTLVASGYYVFYAADQYMSDAMFVVRGQSQSASALSTILTSTTGIGRSEDDTYAVQDFMTSRDALEELVRDNDIRAVFNRPEADALARFPRQFLPLGDNSLWGNSFEHFYEYYQKHVTVELDSTTGVSTMKIRSFRPDDSQKIANALLAAAERLVNRMNERQRETVMGDARKELKLAEGRVEAIAADIAKFRNQQEVVDPTKQSAAMLQSLTVLQDTLIKTKLQLAQIMSSSRQSPLIPEYQQRVVAMQGQIDEAKRRITGVDGSMVPKMTTYDLLTLRREFADKQLASATASLEQARQKAEQKQIYVETIVRPNEADYPAYPRKIASIALVFFGSLGAFGLLSLIAAGAREHKIV